MMDENYWYNDLDMGLLGGNLIARFFGEDAISNRFHGGLTLDTFDEYFHGFLIAENTPIFICYNIGGTSSQTSVTGSHWVSIMIVLHDNNFYVFYKDSLGDFGAYSNILRGKFHELFGNFIFQNHEGNEQGSNGNLCGPMTICNLEIMINEIRRKSVLELLTSFKDICFCGITYANEMKNIYISSTDFNDLNLKSCRQKNQAEIINKRVGKNKNNNTNKLQSNNTVNKDSDIPTGASNNSISCNNTSNRVLILNDVWNFASINVRTLNDATTKNEDSCMARLVDYLDTFKENNLDVIVMQESRITGCSFTNLSNYRIFFSGGLKRIRGVAIAVSDKLIPFVTEFKMINDRLIWIHMNILSTEYVIISAYGPTCEDFLKHKNEETEYQIFMTMLDNLIKSIKTNFPSAVIIIGGDFNARIGKVEVDEEIVDEKLNNFIGDKLSKERNNAGEHLIDFCVTHKFAVVNSFYDY